MDRLKDIVTVKEEVEDEEEIEVDVLDNNVDAPGVTILTSSSGEMTSTSVETVEAGPPGSLKHCEDSSRPDTTTHPQGRRPVGN